MNANCNHQLINDLLLWLENTIMGIEIFVNTSKFNIYDFVLKYVLKCSPVMISVEHLTIIPGYKVT